MTVAEEILEAASTATALIPGPAGAIAAIALKAAAAFAQAGKDPVIEIERILGADPELRKVHAEHSTALDAKFGPKG